jgi:LmbE family N-acetylglucosaminyl deacetylase
MAGWATNEAPGAFINISLEDVAERIGALIARHRPQVVVTYDANGMSGHPDHVRTHEATVAAVGASGNIDKLYFTAIPRSAVARLRSAVGTDAPGAGAGLPGPDFGTPDDQITTAVDVSRYASRKKAALVAHNSQTANFFLLRLPDDVLDRALSRESFRRKGVPAHDGEPLEEDLFAGLR